MVGQGDEDSCAAWRGDARALGSAVGREAGAADLVLLHAVVCGGVSSSPIFKLSPVRSKTDGLDFFFFGSSTATSFPFLF